MGNLFVDLPVPAFNGAGAAVDTSALGATKTIVVGGPFQGTVTIEYANDDAGAFWAPVPNGSFVNQPGRVTIDLAVKWMRASMNAYKGGIANADVGASNVIGGGFFVPLGPAALDISNMPPFKTVVASGACLVEFSEDGTSWTQAFAFQNKGGQSGTIVAKFARVTGGGSAWLGATDLEDDDNEILPPFSTTLKTIFANVDGSDSSGTGTEENPYRTLQRAVRDVPMHIPPALQYFINITNLGDEELPADYGLPAWTGSRVLGGDGNVKIIANQEPLRSLSPADRQVTVTAASANYTTKTIQVTDASKNWAPDSLKGTFLSFGDPSDPLISVIYGNTNNTLLLSGNDSDPVVPEVGWEGTITEPSARFKTSTSDSFAGFQVTNTADIYIAGIRTEDMNDPGATSFVALGAGLTIERSQIIGGWFSNAPRQVYFTSCYGENVFFETRLYLSRAYVKGCSFASPAQLALMIHSGTVLEDMSIRIFDNLTDRIGGGGLTIGGALIKNAPDDGVKMIGGTGTISGLQVDDSGGNGLTFVGPCKYILASVIGSGNTGVGIFCTDGAQIECITVAGTGDKIETANDPEIGDFMVLTKVGAGFRVGTEAVKTLSIAGAANAVNDGTFPVLFVIDADTVAYGNPNGITEDPFLGDFTVDQVGVTGSAPQQVGELVAGAMPPPPFNIVDVFGGAAPANTGTGARMFNT